jgi:hypothetical protein
VPKFVCRQRLVRSLRVDIHTSEQKFWRCSGLGQRRPSLRNCNGLHPTILSEYISLFNSMPRRIVSPTITTARCFFSPLTKTAKMNLSMRVSIRCYSRFRPRRRLTTTFGILHIDGAGDSAKPTAFTITATERQTLLAETRVLAKSKRKVESYIDLCADILLTILTSKLPSAA